jgi:hypothetical protein
MYGVRGNILSWFGRFLAQMGQSMVGWGRIKV